MTTQVQTNNQSNIISSNDELKSTSQMILFETEYERTEKQIIHLEKVFKSHLSIKVNPGAEDIKDSN